MPLDLRYDLRFRRDRTLANRLDAAWRKIERLSEGAVKPSWWDAFHANRMRRSFIRHRTMYRAKARFHVAASHAWAILEGAGGSAPALLVMLPLYYAFWLLAPRGFPRPPEALGEYDAFLLKCEIEDLQDEMARRVRKRSGAPA